VRHLYTTYISDISAFKQKVLCWLKQHEVFSYLDNNEYKDYHYNNYELLVGAGDNEWIEANSGTAFSELENFIQQENDWYFGHLGYDLKNETEKLFSENKDSLHFPDLYFFQPETVIYIKAKSNEVTIASLLNNSQEIFEEISNQEFHKQAEINPTFLPNTTTDFSKKQYLETVEKIRNHIAAGDFYEMNLCMEFFTTNTAIDASQVFNKLNSINNSPFSAFYKTGCKYLICSSPERFLIKHGNKIVSQPIKGTIKRGNDIDEDALRKNQLQYDTKERAENVMIVDLVRNDLAKSCLPGSVNVAELFKVYTFSKVHHLISTISGELKDETTGVQAIKKAFPMGSMTGAPKVIVMDHIEQYEQTKRGLYSGAIGYFSPEGNFDFNVVIRSILYNEKARYVSFQVGSAITFDSVAENEYEECMLKANAMVEALK
jgi:para-aminobenzoate synthetase component 1